MTAGRPIKLNEQWLEIAHLILFEKETQKKKKGESKFNAIFLTDEDLLLVINETTKAKYGEQFCISEDAFGRYKNNKVAEKNLEESILLEKFRDMYKLAIVIQKRELFSKLNDAAPGVWQKIAWIIERKFTEWNLKNINENKNEHSGEINIISTILDEIGENRPDIIKN